MGTKEYSSLTLAESGIGTELSEILSGIKTYLVPIRHLYSFIFETKSAFGNTVKARIIQTDSGKDFLDYRTSAISTASGGGGSGSTTFVGLTDVPDSYTSYQNRIVKINPLETGVEFSGASIDVSNNFSTPGTVTGSQIISTILAPAAPLSVLSSIAVANLNADLLDGYHAASFALASQINPSELTASYIPYWTGIKLNNSNVSFSSGEISVNGAINILNSKYFYKNTTLSTVGTYTVYETSLSAIDGIFFEYIIKKGANLRAGTIMVIHDGTNVEFTEFGTNDLGDTTPVSIEADISSGNLRLLATISSTD